MPTSYVLVGLPDGGQTALAEKLARERGLRYIEAEALRFEDDRATPVPHEVFVARVLATTRDAAPVEGYVYDTAYHTNKLHPLVAAVKALLEPADVRDANPVVVVVVLPAESKIEAIVAAASAPRDAARAQRMVKIVRNHDADVKALKELGKLARLLGRSVVAAPYDEAYARLFRLTEAERRQLRRGDGPCSTRAGDAAPSSDDPLEAMLAANERAFWALRATATCEGGHALLADGALVGVYGVREDAFRAAAALPPTAVKSIRRMDAAAATEPPQATRHAECARLDGELRRAEVLLGQQAELLRRLGERVDKLELWGVIGKTAAANPSTKRWWSRC
jgi:hypothetical protein